MPRPGGRFPLPVWRHDCRERACGPLGFKSPIPLVFAGGVPRAGAGDTHRATFLESGDRANVNFFTFVVILAAVFLGHVAWGKRRLKQWAGEQRLRILSSRYCFVNIGPFSQFGTSAGQAIFRIEARDAAGNLKSGYARTGGFFFGLMRRRVEVKWDRLP